MADTPQKGRSAKNIAPLIGGYFFLAITIKVCILYIL